jgi:hypothetical protein
MICGEVLCCSWQTTMLKATFYARLNLTAETHGHKFSERVCLPCVFFFYFVVCLLSPSVFSKIRRGSYFAVRISVTLP